MSKLDKKDQSQLDYGGVLRSVHQDDNQALRVTNANTSVPPSYTRVDLSYNASNSVTNATFYDSTSAEVRHIDFVADNSASLNDTYFTLQSAYGMQNYHVWYNVDGAGIDPSPVGSAGIEVLIQEDETAEIVALATKLSLQSFPEFEAKNMSDIRLRISNSEKGLADNTVDGGTGFVIDTVQEGTEELTKEITLPFDGTSIYSYNTQERKFEVNPVTVVEVDISADSGDDIAISRHENYRNIVGAATFTKAQLNTAAYTEVYSYTASEDIRSRKIKVKADTFGTFRVKVNGVIKDYYSTSPTDRNCIFEFAEDMEIPNGEDLTIEFVPDRLQIANYDFFFRTEGYVA